MLYKLDQIFTKFIFSIFYIISFKGKNAFGAGFVVFSFVSGIGAYLCFNPPYDYYNYGFLTILIGRTALGWFQIAISAVLAILGIIATYRAFYPEKPIDYEQYLYPIRKSDDLEK